MLVLCRYLQQILPSKQRLFWGSNNANELNLDPGPSEGFVVSRCTCERVDSPASCLVRLKNINMMSTWHHSLFITPVSCLLLYKKHNRCRKKQGHWWNRAVVVNTCCSSTRRFLGPDRWPLCSTRPHICSSPPSCDCSLKIKYRIVQCCNKKRLRLSTVIIRRNI